jgi:DNA-binding NarL/FixJ family response regulator
MSIDKKVRVGIVAADPLRQLGLTTILQDIGLDAVSLSLQAVAGDRRLAALLIDVHSCGASLSDVITRLRADRNEVKIVVVGQSLDPEFIQSMIGAGARGYLTETSSEAEIKMAMDVVMDGSVWAPRKVLARLLDKPALIGAGKASTENVTNKMTPRERDVLHLLMDGSTNRQIAISMGIDEVTVKAHLGRMLRKTGATNRIELTLRAMEEKKSAEGIS